MKACSLLLVGAVSVNALTISQSARCGEDYGTTCLNSQFGNCCSQYGWCGSTKDHCGTGCRSKYGECTTKSVSSIAASLSPSKTSISIRSSPTSSKSSSVPLSKATQIISKNARCGTKFGGQTCAGSQWGNCCSQYSYCGSSIDYCGDGCQIGFGTCKQQQSPSPSRSSSSSRASSTSQSSVSTMSSSISLSTLATSLLMTSSSSAPSTVSSTSSANSAPLSSALSSSSITGSIMPSSIISSSQQPSSTPTPVQSSSIVSSSSSIESSVPSSTIEPSSSIIASATPSPQPTNFCLKVVTPGDIFFGYIVRRIGFQANLVLEGPTGTTYPIALFNLESNGRLNSGNAEIVAPRPPALNAAEFDPTTIVPYQQATYNQNPSNYGALFCSVSATRELVCTSQRGAGLTYTQFSRFASTIQPIIPLAIKTPAANAVYAALNLGVFTGNDCAVAT